MVKCCQIVSLTKFAIFVKFAAFRIPPLSLSASNLRLNGEMSSNRQFRQIRQFRRIHRFPDTPSFARCLNPSFLWRNVVKMVSFTKFAIFVEFAAFWITPSFARHLKSKSLWQISSNRHFPQIRHFRRNRSFPDTPSFARCLKSKFLWRNVVK